MHMINKIQKVAVAGALFNEEGSVLIVQRSQKETYLPGYWELPGGKVNFGEDPKEALIREFIEETGLSTKAVTPVRVFHYVTKEGTLQTVEIVFLLVLSKNSKKDIVLSGAHNSHVFIGSDDLDNYLGNNPEVRQNVVEAFRAYEELKRIS